MPESPPVRIHQTAYCIPRSLHHYELQHTIMNTKTGRRRTNVMYRPVKKHSSPPPTTITTTCIIDTTSAMSPGALCAVHHLSRTGSICLSAVDGLGRWKTYATLFFPPSSCPPACSVSSHLRSCPRSRTSSYASVSVGMHSL
jgi:hypothetical protein